MINFIKRYNMNLSFRCIYWCIYIKDNIIFRNLYLYVLMMLNFFLFGFIENI